MSRDDEEYLRAESALIAALSRYPDALGTLHERIFFSEDHRKLFVGMREQQAQGREIDLLAAAMMSGVPVVTATESMLSGSELDVTQYGNIVYGQYLVRCTNKSMDGWRQERNGFKRLSEMREIVSRLEGEFYCGDTSDTVCSRYKESLRKPCALVKTQYSYFDQRNGGIGVGETVIVGARPGVGKSAFACSLAIHLARYGGTSVELHSLEMMDVSVFNRIACNVAGIDTRKVRFGELAEKEIAELERAADAIDALPLRISENATSNVDQLVSGMLRSEAKVFIYDYLGKIGHTVRGRNRTQEIGEISNKFSNAAKHAGKIVVLCAQLNRDADREERIPRLRDLRDCGEIEQDADQVWLLHDPEFQKNKDNQVLDVEIQLHIEKNREGNNGTVGFRFYKPYQRFYEPSRRTEISSPIYESSSQCEEEFTETETPF